MTIEQRYTIPEENAPAAAAALAKLIKAAKRLDVEPPKFLIEHSHWETYFRSERDKEFNITSRREWHTLTIFGQPVVLEGWEFIGAIHHTSDGNIVASLPGTELDKKYRDAEPTCDHCHVRRARNTTYILRRIAGRKNVVKRVGSSCLKDFVATSSRDPQTIGRWAEYLATFHATVSDMEDLDGERGSRGELAWSLEGFLAASAFVIRHAGWLSKTAAAGLDGVRPTVSLILDYLAVRHDLETLERIRKWGEAAPSDADRALAAAAIEWVSETLDGREDLNDYMYNLTVIVRAGRVTLRTAPLAASLLASYQRALDKQRESKRQYPTSNHIGEARERIEIADVVVEALIDMPPTEWGQSTLVKLIDKSGNVLVWFATRIPDEIDRGDLVDVRCTVVRHETRNGVKQTKVNRCTFSNIRKPASVSVSSDN